MMVATKLHKNLNETIFGFVGQFSFLTALEEFNKKGSNTK